MVKIVGKQNIIAKLVGRVEEYFAIRWLNKHFGKREYWGDDIQQMVRLTELKSKDKVRTASKTGDWREKLAKLLKGTRFALWHGDKWDLSDEIQEIVIQEKLNTQKNILVDIRCFFYNLAKNNFGKVVDEEWHESINEMLDFLDTLIGEELNYRSIGLRGLGTLYKDEGQWCMATGIDLRGGKDYVHADPAKAVWDAIEGEYDLCTATEQDLREIIVSLIRRLAEK